MEEKGAFGRVAADALVSGTGLLYSRCILRERERKCRDFTVGPGHFC